MPPITTRSRRYWLPLLALLTLGACQRASYSFQVPAGVLPPPPAAAPDSAGPIPTAGASLATPGLRPGGSQPRLRHSDAGAPRLPKSVVRLRLLPRLARQAAAAARPVSRLAARPQELLPAAWRTKGIALLLAFFLGGFGAHLFYLGYYGRGIAYAAGTLLGSLLFVIAFVLAVVSLSGGAGLLALAVTGAILTTLVGVLALVDAIRIAIGDFKPKNGAYFPGFFQTRDKP